MTCQLQNVLVQLLTARAELDESLFADSFVFEGPTSEQTRAEFLAMDRFSHTRLVLVQGSVSAVRDGTGTEAVFFAAVDEVTDLELKHAWLAQLTDGVFTTIVST